MQSSRLVRLLPIAIALVAIAIRLAPLMRSDLGFTLRPDDSFEYLQLANGMRHGCGFARLINGVCQPAEILRTPGYPLFLAALGSNMRWAMVTQAVLGGIVCLLIAAWVAKYWSFNAAIVAELLVAFDLPSIVMSNSLMSEALFQFAIVLAIVPLLVAVKRRKNVALAGACAGLLAGFALMVRPIGIIVPIVLAAPPLSALWLSRRYRIASAALALGIPALILAGWAARNYIVAGFPGISTVSAINMYYYRAADIVARQNGTLLDDTHATFGARLGVPYDRIYEAGVQSPELAHRMTEMGLKTVEAHPFEAAIMTAQAFDYLALSPIRTQLANLLGDTAAMHVGNGLNAGSLNFGRIRRALGAISESPLLSALITFQVLTVLLVWVGLVIAILRCANSGVDYRLWVLCPAAAGVLLLLLASGGEADVRFRVPAIPLLAIVAALGYFPREPKTVSQSMRDLNPIATIDAVKFEGSGAAAGLSAQKSLE